MSIILDGENCWEYYPRSGVDFLRELYRRVVEHPKITPDAASANIVEKYPADDKIGTLFAGSWIQHNFGIWIGHPECNRAWDLVFETRRASDRRGGRQRRAKDGRSTGPGAPRTVHCRGERLVLVVRRQPP